MKKKTHDQINLVAVKKSLAHSAKILNEIDESFGRHFIHPGIERIDHPMHPGQLSLDGLLFPTFTDEVQP